MTVDPILTSDPQLAAGINRAAKLLEPILTADPSSVAAEWRSIPENSSEIELELSDEKEGMHSVGRIRSDDLLTGPDRWIQGDLRAIWYKLVFQRTGRHFARLREIIREVEEAERATN